VNSSVLAQPPSASQAPTGTEVSAQSPASPEPEYEGNNELDALQSAYDGAIYLPAAISALNSDSVGSKSDSEQIIEADGVCFPRIFKNNWKSILFVGSRALASCRGPASAAGASVCFMCGVNV
jgi:hypothetical protein